VRAVLAFEFVQGLGDARAILDEVLAHISHALISHELRRLSCGKLLSMDLDILLFHQELPAVYAMPQILELFLEQTAVEGLERDTDLFHLAQDFPKVPDVLVHGPG